MIRSFFKAKKLLRFFARTLVDAQFVIAGSDGKAQRRKQLPIKFLRCRHVLDPQINVIESPCFHRQFSTHPQLSYQQEVGNLSAPCKRRSFFFTPP
jgi:hypothetical protein